MAMEGEIVADKTSSISRSVSKSTVGEKRRGSEFYEKSELGHKRVKMEDLHSVFSPEGIDTHYPKSTKKMGTSQHFSSVEKERSQEVFKDMATTTNSDISQSEITERDTLPAVDTARRSLDLNTIAYIANNSAGGDISGGANKLSLIGKHDVEHDVTFATSKGFSWDLNADDVSSSHNQDPFYPHKNHEYLKSVDASECGSTTGPLEAKDPLSVWKEMKQNGFLSSSHGGIPVPKPRGRKSKSDGLRKKMELAKREQVDRFAKIAAPSGLLNELNPGIINHVRNRKQVHSIIEALVRSEKHEKRHAGGKQAILTSGTKEIPDRKKDMENVNGLAMDQLGLSHENGSLSNISVSQQTRVASFNEPVLLNSDHSGRDGNLSKSERRILGKSIHPNQDSENDLLALKLSSSSTVASENTSSLSNEESANLTSVSSLSVKAANVASQWLELLHKDIKGRLSALRGSKKRVRAVIQTELPFLLSREFSSNQENNPQVMKYTSAGCSDNANADVHQARWSALFDQMEKALSEEEKQLESWLNQVKEMQLHCERGLRLYYCSALHGSSQRLGVLENDSRLEEVENSERELAVRAAAASIYSTCNILTSRENNMCPVSDC